MSVPTVRVNTGDAGYFKLGKETTYGTFVVPDGDPVLYNQGGNSFQDERETVPRRAVAGLGAVEQIQLRTRAGGNFVCDQEFLNQGRQFLGLFGGVETTDAAPANNYFASTKVLESFTLHDPWPGNTAQGALGNNEPQAYIGTMFNSAAWALEGGNPVTVDWGLLSATWANSAVGAVPASFTAYEPIKPQQLTRFSLGGIELIDTDYNNLIGYTLNFNNNLREDVYPGGLAFRGKPQRGEGGATLELEVTMYFDDNFLASGGAAGILSNYLLNNDAVPLIIQADFSTTGRMVWYANVKISGVDPMVNDFGAVVATITAVAENTTVPYSDAAIFPALGTGTQGVDVDNQIMGLMYSGVEDVGAL